MSESPPEETPDLQAPLKTAGRRWRVGWIIPFIFLFMVSSPILILALIGMNGPLTSTKSVVVAHGAGMHEIATALEENGVIINPWLFRLASRVLADDALKAGEYEFPAHESMANVVERMHEGRSVIRNFTAAEGLTSTEIVAMLNQAPLTGTISVVPAEGTLLPETYRYSYGDSRLGVLARMQKGMVGELTVAWDKRDPAVPLHSVEEALVLASLIEKETSKGEERPRIARVFYNRLAQNMKLQSDPTVIYALTMGKQPLNRTLTHADMGFVSPYNTYVAEKLPPGPICNPGRASIEAALHPEANDFLFFVADGTGGHVFAKDLADHNRNVAKWATGKRLSTEP